MLKEKFLNYVTIILAVFAIFYAVFTETCTKNRIIASIFLAVALLFKIVSLILEKRELENVKLKQEELEKILKSNKYSKTKGK